MLIVTATHLTDAARKKAEESTGTDPGAEVYRLHRDSCPRINPKDNPTPVDAAPPDAVYFAKSCTRCSPKTGEVLAVKAEASKARLDSTQPAQEETVPKQKKAAAKKAAAPAPKPDKPAEPITLDVYAGPEATLDRAGFVKPIRPAAYPEVVNHPLRCAGCNKTLPASRFQFVDKRGSGRGRFVECTPCQTERLAYNKAHPGSKRQSPKFPAEVVAATPKEASA